MFRLVGLMTFLFRDNYRIGGVSLIIISSIASGAEPCIAGEGSVWISHIRAWAAFVLWAQLTQVASSSTLSCAPGDYSQPSATVHSSLAFNLMCSLY